MGEAYCLTGYGIIVHTLYFIICNIRPAEAKYWQIGRTIFLAATTT
jgi:hypothetical protein